MMSRVHGWPALLAAHVEAARAAPFAWGAHDCCTFAARWVELAQGRANVLAAFARAHGNWASPALAMRCLRAAGGLPAIAERELGAPIRAAFAARGDVVLVDIDGRESLAVVVGDTAAGPGLAGLSFLPRVLWRQGWKV